MSDIDTLVEMGFARNRAEKALSATKNQGVQLAMDWLFAHADDVDIDELLQPSVGHALGQDETLVQDEEQEIATNEVVEEPATKQGQEHAQASSLKCEDCGKLLKSEGQVQMHAARTGHQNFAESTDEIKPLTEEEKKEQMENMGGYHSMWHALTMEGHQIPRRIVEELMREIDPDGCEARLQAKKLEKRQQRLETEKQENVEREKIRRKSGKEMIDYKQRFQMQEAQKIAEQRRREKIEEKQLRQKLKEQIAEDRAKKASQPSPVKTVSSPAVAPSNTTQSSLPPKEYTSCRLQFRLTNGVSITGTFTPTDTLSKVVSYVSEKRTDGSEPFLLSTTFPRKIFSESDMDKTLKDCGLVPSAVLILTKH